MSRPGATDGGAKPGPFAAMLQPTKDPGGIASASPLTGIGGSPLRGFRVLIIDDQSTGRTILSRLVQGIDPDLEVEGFADPLDALADADGRCPDLVLTDYKMPGMDGIEFTKRFRALGSCVDVPLIMVTVVEDPDVRYKALDAGATDFLVRPVDQYECEARCRNLLTLRRQQKIIKNRAQWLEQQVSLATRQIRVREKETLLRLAKAGEYRDEGTGNHVLRMAKYSRLIAEQLGLATPICEEIELAAPMHDIGKIGIPDYILLKPSALTTHEWEIMKTHTSIGHAILKDSPSRFIQQGAVIALGHHEKYDGSGYPRGLKGEEIPLIARIVTVADVYDALTSTRPYKPAWSPAEVAGYIREQAGLHFDTGCARALLERIDSVKEIENQLRDRPDKRRSRER
jgi:two-component system response regulator RpfG